MGIQPSPCSITAGLLPALSPPFVSSDTIFYVINSQPYQSSVICVLKMPWQS